MSSISPTLIFNDILLPSTSMSSNITTPSYDVTQANTLAVQAVWSGGGTPVGNMYIAVSTDNINFTTNQDSVLPVSGNSGSNFYNIQDIGYRYIRLLYVRTSGTASLLVNISGKYS